MENLAIQMNSKYNCSKQKCIISIVIFITITSTIIINAIIAKINTIIIIIIILINISNCNI